MSVLLRQPSQKPVPASNTLPGSLAQYACAVRISYGDKNDRKLPIKSTPMITAPTTLLLFLQKRLKASLANVVGRVSNFWSWILVSLSLLTRTNLEGSTFGILLFFFSLSILFLRPHSNSWID